MTNLVGTPKQIAWAEDIKPVLVERLQKACDYIVNRYEKKTTSPKWESSESAEYFETREELMDAVKIWAESKVAALQNENSAAKIIDMRDNFYYLKTTEGVEVINHMLEFELLHFIENRPQVRTRYLEPAERKFDGEVGLYLRSRKNRPMKFLEARISKENEKYRKICEKYGLDANGHKRGLPEEIESIAIALGKELLENGFTLYFLDQNLKAKIKTACEEE